MKKSFALLALAGVAWGADLRSAARYLDERQKEWFEWPRSLRENGVRCLSCHTGAPYLLARAPLRRALEETQPTSYETGLFEGIKTRVRAWDAAPYYPAKDGQSRGTEAIWFALFLAADDSQHHRPSLSPLSESAFEHLWALQIQTGPKRGSWEWLDFSLDPWETPEAAYYGAALAAIAAGSAPGDYAQRAAIQDHLSALRQYLRDHRQAQSLHNRLVLLWASAKLPQLLAPEEQQAIVEDVRRKQNADGGWSLKPGLESDAYATGLAAFAMQQAGARVPLALDWLNKAQNPASGAWPSRSLNKVRDPNTHAGKFMIDAATAYAALALLAAEDLNVDSRPHPGRP